MSEMAQTMHSTSDMKKFKLNTYPGPFVVTRHTSTQTYAHSKNWITFTCTVCGLKFECTDLSRRKIKHSCIRCTKKYAIEKLGYE